MVARAAAGITKEVAVLMNKMQQQLVEFHHDVIPAVDDPKLRATLIMEESTELCEALLEDDAVEIIDGMCDLIYVVLGTAVAYGIDLEPYFDEVHRTNMLKASGPLREDGKRLKPPGWQPPRIDEMLANGVGIVR